jgi:hypothetical protein
MKDETFLILEKENRQIIIFDVLEFTFISNSYSSRIVCDDMSIKLKSNDAEELLTIYEFHDHNNYLFKSVKYDIKVYRTKTANTLSLKGCTLSEVTFDIDETYTMELVVDYHNYDTSDENTLSLIKSFKRDEKLKSIGIL